jgi:hypothetical protein
MFFFNGLKVRKSILSDTLNQARIVYAMHRNVNVTKQFQLLSY